MATPPPATTTCLTNHECNPPPAGGPALQGDQVVGVAFQNLPGAENIGYIIPTPVVRHFLSEVRKYGSYQVRARARVGAGGEGGGL